MGRHVARKGEKRSSKVAVSLAASHEDLRCVRSTWYMGGGVNWVHSELRPLIGLLCQNK
jgi:hypothetical protein